MVIYACEEFLEDFPNFTRQHSCQWPNVYPSDVILFGRGSDKSNLADWFW